MMTIMSALETAHELLSAGISVVPVTSDGQKRPAGRWAQYQQHRAQPDVLEQWFGTEHGFGVGVITGSVSGNLEMTEVEGRGSARIPDIARLAHDTGLGELWARLCNGWLEQSPSGGWHWLYRVDGTVPGNTKIASRPSTPEELAANPRQKKQVIAETRGEGGYVVVAPSDGTVHPSGKPWKRVTGGPRTLPTITMDEREAFHALLGTLHEDGPVTAQPVSPQRHLRSVEGGRVSPGDDFENKTDWAEILTGWEKITQQGRTRYWRRPGKNIGISATTGRSEERDRLFVFTTSTEFEQETPYTKFGAYALLHHNGDHKAAAADLRAQGYGTQPDERIKLQNLTLKRFDPTPALPADSPDSPDSPTFTDTLTDHGNAQILIRSHGSTIRYAPAAGTWMTWDGARWKRQPDDGPLVEFTWETIAAIDDQGKEAIMNHKHRSLSRRALEAAVGLARYDSRVRVNVEDLDAHPYELNAPNGIIDLRSGDLLPNDPGKLHTKITFAGYNREATAPRWEKFLQTTFNGDAAMIAYVKRLAGYAATGDVTHHILPFLHGSGGNGKSAFLEVIVAVLGDYATSAPGNFLMSGREHHETEIARLAGMRMIVCSEINKDAKFDEAKVKLLTGGDRLTARFMARDFFTFVPSHTLFVNGNYQPKVSAGGDSFWRRLRLLSFLHKVTDAERVDDLPKKLIADEAEGILRWLVEGAVDVLRDGMHEPQNVLAATDEYAEEEDALARFLADRCTTGPASHYKIDTALMRREYAQWCREQGEPELNPQQFGRDLKTRLGVEQIRSHGKRYYAGLTILAEPEPDDHWSKQ